MIATSGSLWAISWWEPLAFVGTWCVGLLLVELLSGRARANRAKLRRRRRSERCLVRRSRAW